MGSIEFGSIPAGVEQVRTDKDKNQVTVTGTMDAKGDIFVFWSFFKTFLRKRPLSKRFLKIDRF